MEEILEMQEEEASLINELESLVSEFQENFKIFDRSLNMFPKTQWKPRMHEILIHNSNKLDEMNLQTIGKIEVIME